MRILFANDEVGVAGGVQSYLEAVMQGLAARGHQLALVHCDEHSDRLIGPSLATIPHFSVQTLGLVRSVEDIVEWSPDICFSHNMRRLDVERVLLDAFPVVKLMHCYFGTCIGGQKTFFLPEARPCQRKFGKACLALYLPRRCGGLNPGRMFIEYEWANKQKALFREYSAVVVASQHMKDEYVRNGMDVDKTHVNPMFSTVSAPEVETPPVSDSKPLVLFLGRMTKLKGGDVLIRAVAEASRILGQEIELVMAGEGPRKASWERLALRLRVQAKFPGWVTGEEHIQLLKATTLLAVPSLWPEPFGLVGLEAACFGVPAVAFDVGGIHEWLRDGVNGFLVKSHTPTAHAFADGLVKALRQPEILATMREAARDTARELSLRKHLDGIETVLSGACRINLSERSGEIVSIV